MEKAHLAIATVPCQSWGETYSPEEALKRGTVFKELDLPFFASDLPAENSPKAPKSSEKSQEQREREAMMTEINETSFVLDDLALYLDNHPADKEGLAMFQEFSKKRAELKKQFAAKFYPLTRDCMAECMADHSGYCWQEGPIPWEGACL